MTKTPLKKYWLILTSAGCLGTAIGLACAGDYGPDYGTSNFTPQLFVDKAYSPFLYSWQFYYDIGHDESHITRFNNSNVQEWSGYLGKTIRPETIDYLLHTATIPSIDSAIKVPASDKKMKAFLDYLRLAKKCEAFSLTTIDRWEVDTPKKNRHFNATTLNRQLQEKLIVAPDAFLQERYWFQLVRSGFFNTTPQETIRIFDSYNAKFPTNTLWFRSLAYKAGAYYKLKDYSKANYFYSLVFSGCDELKTVAHYSFHPQEQKDWQGTLALCRNNEEKTTLWQMLGVFYSDPERAIEEIYQLSPNSEKLHLLLARAVNMYEQRFSHWQTRLNDYPMPITTSDSSDEALLKIVTRIADAGNTAKPWVWQLAAGYLNMLHEHYPAATAYYAKAASTVPKDPRSQGQLRLLKLLNTLAATHTIDGKLEQKILPDIEWLINTQQNLDIRNYDALEWTKKVLAVKYQLTGDRVKSECFSTRSAFYTSNNNIEALKAFFSKPDPTPYEQLCRRLSVMKRQDLFEYQAIQLCMNDRIDEAMTALKEADSAAKTILPANPFNARIQDCHDCDHAAAQKIKYTKSDLLHKLKELKDKIAAGQDVYTNAILFANAQYNITHYGNARKFYECNIFGSDQSSPWSIDSSFRAPLTSMKTAIKYYTTALGAARDDEQKAKCQYLLAKCQRNEWYNQAVYAHENNRFEEHTPDFIAWDGFKALKQYANTKYYNEALKECGYFKTYTK
jgi:hypothetical protein